MVNSLVIVLATLVTVSPGSALDDPGTEPNPNQDVGSALGKAGFTWYDPHKDSIKSLSFPADVDDKSRSNSSREGPGSSSKSRDKETRKQWSDQETTSRTESSPSLPSSSIFSAFGNMISVILLVIALVVLVGLLVWFWRIYEPLDDLETPKLPKKQADPTRVDSLPEGMQGGFGSSDPWSEAIRRRNQGDLAGSIICLFAHQLLTLSKLGLVRLSPGRTGRQLLRSVSDGDFRGLVHPTLRLFEVVYYGHRDPSAEEFEALWQGAEAFERRVAAGGVR